MIVYDLQATQSIHHGERGIARYSLELAAALERRHPGLVDLYTLNPDLPAPGTLGDAVPAERLVDMDDPRLRRATLFHVTSPMENALTAERLLPQVTRRGHTAVVVTLYDLIPLIYPAHYLAGPTSYHEYLRGLSVMMAADALVAISQATADDGHRLLGIPRERMTVIGAGAAAQFRTPPEGRAVVSRRLEAELPRLRPGFVLVPTGIDYRKNVELTMEAYASLPPELRRRHQLVIACRLTGASRQRLVGHAEQLAIVDDVLLTDYVTDATLVALYQTTDLVVFPSRYEGFGLPPLEARRCGAPVICGDNSSLREVVVDPAARFDAESADDIARALHAALVDDAFRRRLSEAPVPEFTWERAADLTAALYRRLVPAVAQRPTRRLRVAAVLCDGPDAPDAAGATPDDRAAVVEALREHVDVTVVRDPGSATREVRQLRLRHGAGLVDEVVYLPAADARPAWVDELRDRVRGVVLAPTAFAGRAEVRREPGDAEAIDRLVAVLRGAIPPHGRQRPIAAGDR